MKAILFALLFVGCATTPPKAVKVVACPDAGVCVHEICAPEPEIRVSPKVTVVSCPHGGHCVQANSKDTFCATACQ